MLSGLNLQALQDMMAQQSSMTQGGGTQLAAPQPAPQPAPTLAFQPTALPDYSYGMDEFGSYGYPFDYSSFGAFGYSPPAPAPQPAPTFAPAYQPLTQAATAMPTAAAPVQGALTAAAPTITPEMWSSLLTSQLKGAADWTPSDLTPFMAPQMALIDQGLNPLTGIFSTPGAWQAYQQPRADFKATQPQFSLSGDEDYENVTVSPRMGAAGYNLFSNGQLVGTATSNEELTQLITQANEMSGKFGEKADIRIDEFARPGFDQGVNLYTNAPKPEGAFVGALKFLGPMALAALSGGLLAKPIALALGAKAGAGGALTGGLLGAGKTIGAGLATGLGSTAGNLVAGKPLGQSLTSGALSGLTAGALSGLGVGQPGGFLGGAKSTALGGLGNLAADLGPDAITVLANKLPSIIPAIASGAGGALSNLLPSEGGVGAPGQYIPPTEVSGLDILANRFPTGSAFPGAAAGVSGIGQTALDTAQQPQQPPQERTPEDEIVVTGRPDAPIVTSALPFPPIDFTGATPPLPDLSVRPDVTPATDDEIVVTGEGLTAPTGGLTSAVSSAVGNMLTQQPLPDPNEMLVEANPIDDPAIGPPVNLFTELNNPTLFDVPTDAAPPEKTSTQKALTTAGRILTVLSVLGALGGRGGGGGASALGPGAAALGTRASLDPVFGGQLPAPGGLFASQGMAPRDMGDIDYERYGYGPARSFFENVPETPEQYRAALAANAPRPMVSGAGMVGVPNILANFPPPAMGSAEVQAVRRLAPGVSDAQIEAFLATPEGADFLAAIQEAGTLQGAARGGAMSVKGTGKPSRDSYAVKGAGTGRSDDIPALLSDGEYVIDAETVAMLGDGSSKAGAKRLDDLRVKIRKHKGRNLAKGRFSDNAKAPEKYLSGGRT